MDKKIPIVLIGPYPPNIGGVSTHIARLLPLLKASGSPVQVISVNPISSKDADVKYVSPYILLFVLWFRRKSILHFHVDSLSHLAFAVLLQLRHTTYLTVHNNRYPTTMKSTSLRNKMKWKFLSNLKKIICVNRVTQEYLQSKLTNVHSTVIPAFLRPKKYDDTTIADVKEWGSQFEHVLSGYAYRLSFHQDQDLYGLDMMIGLMKELKQRKINAGLVLLINLEKNAYLDSIRQDIEELKLENSILILDIKSGYDAVALWNYCDIYLRPTNTDGNSISVLEALTMGTAVVASDCVERPEGTKLFKNRDINDFTNKVVHVLAQKNKTANMIQPTYPSILSIYERGFSLNKWS